MLPVGRSGAIWSFQQFERALKLIIVRSDLRGYASKTAKILRDKDKDIDRKPLDWLVQNFFDTLYSNHSSHDGPANELDEMWISMSLRIESTKNSIRHRRRHSANSSKRETCWFIGYWPTSIQTQLRTVRK